MAVFRLDITKISTPTQWIGDSRARMWWSLGFLGALLFLFGLNNHGLWGAQEPYVGGIIREMADSGDWIVPTLNGHPYLEKPPLYYIVGALIARGSQSFDPWVLRLPSAVFALATMAWVAWLGIRRESPAAGWWAAVFLGTSDLFFRIGHTAIVDMSLVFAVSLGLGFAWLLVEEPEHRKALASWLWISLGFGFLAKGLIGPILVGLPVVVQLLVFRDRALLKRIFRPQWGMIVGPMMAAAWCGLLFLRGGWPYVEEAIIRNSLGRFLQSASLAPVTGSVGEHQEPLWFYFTHSPFNLLPWMFLVLAALFASRHRLGWRDGNPGRFFIPMALLVDVLFLSLSGMKRAVYFLPLAPILFLHTAIWLERRIRDTESEAESRDRTLGTALALSGALVYLAVAVGPWLMTQDYGLSRMVALAYLLAATALVIPVILAWKRGGYRVALDGTLCIWTVGLTLMIFVVPVLKDAQTRRVEQPFHLARERVETTGAEVWESGLAEADLGMASLIIRKPLERFRDPSDIPAILAQDKPIAILIAPEAVGEEVKAQGNVMQPEIPKSGERGQGLCVILNEKALVGLTSDSRVLIARTALETPGERARATP